jgi:hypothetical protein
MGGGCVYSVMRRIGVSMLLVCLLASGCARPANDAAAPPGDPDQVFRARAAKVADAWRASGPGSGFVPLQDLTVAPADPGFTDETKQAFVNGWFRLAITLPDHVPAPATIRFSTGTLSVPLIGADAAYQAMDRGDPPPCLRPLPDVSASGTTAHSAQPICKALTVTAVDFGEVDLRTSRGIAKVPAWRFTVEGVKGTIARVAVAPSAIGALPSPSSLEPLPPDAGLISASDLVSADGTKLTFTLGVGACDYAIEPLVLEQPDLVLVGGTRRTRPGACIDLLKLEPVTITLDQPLGTRVILNGLTGAPLTAR